MSADVQSAGAAAPEVTPENPGPAPATPAREQQVSEALARSVCCRTLSLLFSPPGPARQADLAALVPSMPAGLRERLAPLAALGRAELEAEYHRVLGSSGQVPVCESDHGGSDPGRKGAVLADNAGFYKAFAYDFGAELAECPDHVAVQWGFLGYLALKEALALSRGEPERAELCREAAVSFHANHVEPWFGSFLGRVAGASPEGFLGRAAQLAVQVREALAFPAAERDSLCVLPPSPELPHTPPACCCPDED